MISIIAATIRNQRSLVDLAENAKEGEWEWEIPLSFYNEERLGEHFTTNGGLLHSFLNLLWKAKSKDPVGKNQARGELLQIKYAFSAETRRRIKRCIQHAILWLSVLTCVQIPRLRKNCYCCSWWQNYWPCISWFGSRWSMVPLSVLARLCTTW